MYVIVSMHLLVYKKHHAQCSYLVIQKNRIKLKKNSYQGNNFACQIHTGFNFFTTCLFYWNYSRFRLCKNMKITLGPSLSTIWQHTVGGSTPCFDPFIPGEHWIGCLLGHGNGLDVEQWTGAGCQCITMNRKCRHKEHMSKITLLDIKRYTFTNASFFLS
jgi:hypothetical protein